MKASDEIVLTCNMLTRKYTYYSHFNFSIGKFVITVAPKTDILAHEHVAYFRYTIAFWHSWKGIQLVFICRHWLFSLPLSQVLCVDRYFWWILPNRKYEVYISYTVTVLFVYFVLFYQLDTVIVILEEGISIKRMFSSNWSIDEFVCIFLINGWFGKPYSTMHSAKLEQEVLGQLDKTVRNQVEYATGASLLGSNALPWPLL